MSFARSLMTVSGLTVLSRVAGFVRDTLTASFLGAGPIADAFFVAQRLPNLFRSLFAEGAFTAAFVPLYASESEKKGPEAAKKFAGEALSFLIAALVPFCALIILFMPQVVSVIAPGFQDDAEKFEMAVFFSRITFPYLALISITALQSGVLNAHNRFGPPAAAPIGLNLVMIAGLLGVGIFGLPAGNTLAWSLTIAGIVQAVWLAISCHRAGLSIPLMMPHLSEASRRLFKQIGPGALGAGAAQVNLFLSTILASTLPTGAVSYLYYADRLNQLPLGIVGIAVATTLLPILSRHIAGGKEENVRHYTSRAIEFCLLLGLPAAIGLACAAKPIIQTLFEHGAFTSEATRETAKALGAYALGIPAFLLVKVLATNFFAHHDVKTPVRFAFVSLATNIFFALVLLGPLGHVGIALATSIATWTNAGLLFFRLKKRGEKLYDQALLRRIPRLMIAAVGMGGVTFAATNGMQDWLMEAHFLKELGALGLILTTSVLAYIALIALTGAIKWQEVKAILGARKG